ncbi:cell division protein FtsZ [Cohnella sp. AR92]|uniref:cell division protein FtsZ n=1 Tax=Cohnella sp. AR92 TaxID=648716 RepID=UPI000F8E526F|nr:cell division protein FtsZ [Cohnella sp. AR92]RUS44953.1 cell division protein FtsZ [Cohnella sp. AR92]
MSFRDNTPSIDITVVGYGQAGSRIADKFAAYKSRDGKPVYNCLALNSNDGDLEELRYIPQDNRISLKLGGLGKNPEKALNILEQNEQAKETLKDFITKKVRVQDSLVLFIAGLGGGTGTATIVKAIEEFHEFYNLRLVKQALVEIRKQVGDADFKQNFKKHQSNAYNQVKDQFKKIGVIATIPVRSDGPDVLRQVNDFASRIWDMAKNPTKGIAFVDFPDNQMFYERFQNEVDTNSKNYRDFANNEISSIFHELNTATNGSGTSVIMDSNDFKRILLEKEGCLVLNRVEQNVKSITNSDDLTKLFVKSIESNNLHDPIALQKVSEDGEITYARVHHVGLLGVIPPDLSKLGSSFIDNAKEDIVNKLPLQGTIFSGYLNEPNNFKVTVYSFYKADALPERLSKGLVKEYEEFMAKQRTMNFSSDTIQQIAVATDEEFDLGLDPGDFGISIADVQEDKPTDDDFTADDVELDFSGIDPNNL